MTQSPHTAGRDARPPASDPSESVAGALGRIPSGLFVVTWREHGRDRGMLASWVMQAGFAPPMVSVAVAVARDLLAALRANSPFVVNVLADSQRPLLARFGKPAGEGDDPFAGLAVGRSPSSCVTIDGAAAWLECAPMTLASGGESDRGDHVVVLARVVAAETGDDRPPIVHLRRNGLRY